MQQDGGNQAQHQVRRSSEDLKVARQEAAQAQDNLKVTRGTRKFPHSGVDLPTLAQFALQFAPNSIFCGIYRDSASLRRKPGSTALKWFKSKSSLSSSIFFRPVLYVLLPFCTAVKELILFVVAVQTAFFLRVWVFCHFVVPAIFFP